MEDQRTQDCYTAHAVREDTASRSCPTLEVTVSVQSEKVRKVEAADQSKHADKEIDRRFINNIVIQNINKIIISQ